MKGPPNRRLKGPLEPNGCGAAGNFTDGFTQEAPGGPQEAPEGPRRPREARSRETSSGWGHRVRRRTPGRRGWGAAPGRRTASRAPPPSCGRGAGRPHMELGARQAGEELPGRVVMPLFAPIHVLSVVLGFSKGPSDEFRSSSLEDRGRRRSGLPGPPLVATAAPRAKNGCVWTPVRGPISSRF